ncbi:MAG: hypothetical protein SVR08_13815 [Spirochaetota bacterium]|nr:hypothetical protein [Spirochaetota bacterium]
MLSIIKYFSLLIVLCVIIILVIFIIFGLQSEPLVVSGRKLTYSDAARVKHMIRQNKLHDLKRGEVKRIYLTERDLNLFFDYALSRSRGRYKLGAKVYLYEDYAKVDFTYSLPRNPFGSYLNMTSELSFTFNSISIDKLKIGELPIPGWFAGFMLKLMHKYLQQYDRYQSISQGLKTIKEVRLRKRSMIIVYQWQPDLLNEIQNQSRGMFLPKYEQEHLPFYNNLIMNIATNNGNKLISLSRVFQILFRQARKNSTSSGNAVAENRILIIALTINSVGTKINRILGMKKKSGFKRLRLTLLGRQDLAKHFLVSAAITVSAGTGLANLAGIFKEIDDSRGGSGFSFADLSADRAGVRFAQKAVTLEGQAVILQQRMSSTSLRDTDYMPYINNLPEGIMELQFKRKFKDLNSENYHMIDMEIENRISQCKVYK